ncbi:hypothetical protein Taro_048630 [Colocasia esculenta]|uniref:Putative plant transposon protein domain-containing protein n=1 Tax=Colocasia esculenta TaxID=4460 RepID=A0A843X8L7_COLES|nr:hypothetical protein [Colocasia esculenta]
MERHKPFPQPFFPSYNRTPKYLGCLNTLHPNPRDEFTTCWGHVVEFLVAGELWIDHKKDVFFPCSSTATCTNRPLEVNQRIPLFAPKSLEGFCSTILQNLSLFKSMAVSAVFNTVGGYNTAFLTTEQQERFAAVKTKLCGNKAVDVADLEKNGMHSVVATMQRMKWTKMVTISEASYPDLVKAFYTYLKSEADGSLTSIVKAIPIHITYDLLESLFGVSTSGRSGVDSDDIHVKGLEIISTKYKLKDGKIDINQLNAFNRILHFIVCQILVPRSATLSTCPKADSDIMFWAIQNQDINMAEVIIERMKFATAMIWDKKNKINVSLPYAHLLTRIFQHFNIDLNGEVSDKMGQAIRSRNLKKNDFSLVAGVWTKTSVAEGEAIIGEAQEVHVPEAEAEAEVRVEDPVAEALAAPAVLEEAAVAVTPEELVASPRRIEEIPLEHIEPVGQSSKVDTPMTVITSILHDVLDIVASIQGEQVEVVPEVVAPGHSDVQVEDAPGSMWLKWQYMFKGSPQLAPMLISFKKVLWRAPRMKVKFLLIMWSQLLAPVIKAKA